MPRRIRGRPCTRDGVVSLEFALLSSGVAHVKDGVSADTPSFTEYLS
ncbi:hypothetical protein QF001_008090 [Paraburkholderia youngii]